MSILRNKLDRAKADYHSAGYPGDLAAELLPMQMDLSSRDGSGSGAQVRPVTSNRWYWAGGLGSAAAAALVVGMFLNAPTPTGNNNTELSVNPPSTTIQLSPLNLRGIPAVPEDGRFRLVEWPVTQPGRPEVGPQQRFTIEPEFRTLEYTQPKH